MSILSEPIQSVFRNVLSTPFSRFGAGLPDNALVVDQATAPNQDGDAIVVDNATADEGAFIIVDNAA